MEFLLLVLLLGLIVLGALGYGWHYLSQNVLNPSGKGAVRRTTGTLSKYAAIRRFKVLSDVTLTADGKTAHVENILIGFFGILLVHTCGARGEYYGTVDGEDWIITRDGTRATIPNPLREQQKAMAIMRTLFSKNKLYNLPIENVVYLSSKGKKTGLFITHSGQILLPGKLAGYLGKTKFDKDTGLDVQRVAEALTSPK